MSILSDVPYMNGPFPMKSSLPWDNLPNGKTIASIRKELEMKNHSLNDANGEGSYSDILPWEKDPNGYELKTPGAKADAGKICVTQGCLHYFPRAIRAVAELSTIGAKKYSWKGWSSVPDGINRYGDALGRHELQIEGDFTRKDQDTGVLEATAVAWNALARLELILRQK